MLELRDDFPILAREVHGKPLIYFDNAASAQRPQCVLDAMAAYYAEYNANVHRGVHHLSQIATDHFESARDAMGRFLGTSDRGEVIFTRGATDAINLVAQAFVRPRVGEGDEIVISHMEHHSNIVPWQLVCEQTGATLRVVPINARGELELEALDELLSERVKFLSLIYVSNALGTINPVARVIEKAHQLQIPVMLDAAQAAPHLALDVHALDCDFLAVAGHKMYGPTGIGVLYGKRALLEAMPPYQGGGEMISHVSFDGTVYAELPAKFEAGTPNIAGAIGLGRAAEYLMGVGFERIAHHEAELLDHATRRLQAIDGLNIVGTAKDKAAVISFVVEGTHPTDIGTLIDHRGIALRTGHHCAMPAMDFFKVPATARASMGLYNTCEEIDVFVEALQDVLRMLR